MLGVFDLTKDPAPILQMGVEELVKVMQGPDRAIRIVTSNRMPAVVDIAVGPDFGVPETEIVRRASQIVQDAAFAARVGQALAQRYPPWPAAEVVEARMQALHVATWPERAELVETFDDGRLRELGRRIVFFEQPEFLRPELREGLETWLRNRLHGREGVKAGRTVGDALSELTDISPADPGAQSAVSDIRIWLKNMSSDA